MDAAMTGRRIFVWVTLVSAALFFLTPLIMTLVFSLWEGRNVYGFDNYAALWQRRDVAGPLTTTLMLSAATIAAVYLLLAPAMIAAHLYAPRLSGILELASALPFVIPAISLVAGLSALITGPAWLLSSPFYLVIPYVFLVLPYAFRALDVGLSALDARLLREAAESLGAGPMRIVLQVIAPNLRAALVNCALLGVIIVMGEFTIANLLLYRTFPVAIFEVGRGAPMQASALSLINFIASWIAMLVILRGARQKTRA
jgi:putative spermidine/putrescine transport system permease protein